MDSKKKIWIFLVGIFAGGLPSWLNGYNQEYLIGINFSIILCVATVAGALILKLILNTPAIKTATGIAVGVVAAFIIRIMFDLLLLDSASHNLLPFEIIYVSLIAFPSAFAGTYLGHAINKERTESKRTAKK